ncbi:MAG: hypothetical protein Q8O92_04185 [Candidatus Latescibacter sp.]|nr:hypothetical protein [Candidatus Latescibacter sp.]
MKLAQGLSGSVFCLLLLFPVVIGAENVMVGKGVVVKAGTTVESAVSFGDDVQVYGTVTDAAVSFGSDVVVENGGKILGDAVSIGGSIRVNDNGSIGRDAVSLGGTVDVSPSGIISGQVVKIQEKWSGFSRSWREHWKYQNPMSDAWNSFLKVIVFGPLIGVGGILGAFLLVFFFMMRLLLLLAVAILAVLFFPEQVNRLARFTGGKFGMSFLMGLLIMVVMPFFFLFMLVTILGIPFIPLAAACLFLIYLYGSVGVALWAGRLFPKASSRSDMMNTIIGVLAISLLRLVPGVGLLVWILLVTVSLGSVILSRMGAQQYQAQ